MMRDEEIYRLHYGPLGIRQMQGTYAANRESGLFDAITLFRFDDQRPFEEEERQMLQSLVPHLIDARQINFLEHLSGDSRRAKRLAVAAFDRKGVMHAAGSGFAELMQAEWPRWQGPCLSAPLLKARSRSAVDDLSKRELEVARHFANGLSNKEVALLPPCSSWRLSWPIAASSLPSLSCSRWRS